MIALVFELHAQDPLLITRLQGDPNSSVSYPYVPGSVIRGALVHRYRPTSGLDLARDPASRRLFFDGSTRYLNAYPADHLGGRTLPAPLSWYHEKGSELQAGLPIYDFSVERADLDHPSGLGERFCRLDGELVEFIAPQWQISVHTARERIKGRATEAEGAVFRYQAMAAGEQLSGVILASDEEDAATLKELLEREDLWLGGSRSGGYGRAYVKNIREVADWTEAGTLHADLKPGDELIITLLSETALRNEKGAYADCLAPDLLPTPLGAAVQLKSAFKRVAPLGGFNRKWGLPYYQVPALQPGSVFVFDVIKAIGVQELRRLEAQGIGERRVEGLGRVAINWHREPVLTVETVPPEEKTMPQVTLDDDGRGLAHLMVERLLRRSLDRLLMDYIQGRDMAGAKRWPSNAQLSRLRAIALNALPSGDVGRLVDFLSDQKLKARAREQYREARIDRMRLLDWLQARLGKAESVWEHLSQDEIPMPQIGDVRARLTDDLAKEYTIRLVEGVLHRATKERGND